MFDSKNDQYQTAYVVARTWIPLPTYSNAHNQMHNFSCDTAICQLCKHLFGWWHGSSHIERTWVPALTPGIIKNLHSLLLTKLARQAQALLTWDNNLPMASLLKTGKHNRYTTMNQKTTCPPWLPGLPTHSGSSSRMHGNKGQLQLCPT